jgi:SAM-dependent methyltransferase
MAVNKDVAHYTGEPGQQYATRFSDPRNDILGRCFVDRVGNWISPSDKVFEFGCGKGRNMLALQCKERAGYDINEYSIAAAAEAGLQTYRTTDEIPRGYWNVVVCNHVLEHVAAPITMLELFKSLLAPGGKLILTVPVEGHLTVLRPMESDIDHHLYCWNPTTIRNVLDAAGFRVKDVVVRSAAAEDRVEPLARISWRAFKLATQMAGVILRRYEMTSVAEVQ